MRFRKRPVELEAQQFDGSNESAAAILYWIGESQAALEAAIAGHALAYVDTHGTLLIRTLESGEGGYHTASPGDWIVQGIKGEFYPCKPDIFAGSYDAVPMGGFLPEPMVPVGVVKGLEQELAKARGEWNAEVRRLKDGRRERIASRVLAALVGTEPWVAIEEANVDAHIERMEHLVRRATVIADIQVLALDANPPLSVPTERVR